MNLEDVHKGIKKFRKRQRIGRGIGSGHGKTSTKGHKGQKSRSGWSQHPLFQGGAMPMIRRVPKRGFNNKWALKVATVNVSQLEELFDAGAEVTPDALKEKSVAKKRYDVLKILGDGKLTKKLTVSAHRFSKSARDQIEKAGGRIVQLREKTPVEEHQKIVKASKAAKA